MRWFVGLVESEEYQRNQFAAAARIARLVKTRIISRRYSGVNAEVVNGLADAMRQLGANPDLRAEMSSRALKAARENTWEHVVSRTYKHVQDTLRNT